MNTRSFGLVAKTSLFSVAKPAQRGATRFARFSMRALAFLLVCFGALGAANLLAQGTLTSGEMAHGDISAANEIDTWTFTANAGESLIVRMGEMIAGSSLSPWVRLMGPNGVLLSQATSAAAAEASFRATNSGTFTVLVGDGNASHLGTGPYRLTLARSGVAASVASGDEGGSLTNGLLQTGFIDVGDLDLWTFTANAGDNFAVRVAESVSGSSLGPWIRLYSPDGVLLDQDATAVGVEAAFRATNSGLFLVVIGDGNIGLVGSGPYRITLAKTGSAVEVSPGDEGGPLSNGIMHTGVLEVGDLDLWTFTANAGDNFAVRIGETSSSSSLAPTLRLYGPTGVLLGVSASAVGAEVAFRATNNGTFLVVVGDGNNGLVGSGPYRLTLAKTGSPV
ncbi:MAG TPA: hypothetical protein VNU68_23340, partial [Verrucomicrobiae bacterium]|nr:hypothetical protein [Verrucomicrobiae bacterium]